jgi:hypothetical protein
MIKFEEFADPKKHTFNNLESKMARAYRETISNLESASRELWDTMRVDDSMLPYFLPDYEEPAQVIYRAEDRLAEIQSDIENFVSIVGGYSRQEIAEKLNRCKLDIANAKPTAHNILKRAIQENPELSPDNVEKLDVVQTAFAERDRIIAELKPIITDLERKLMEAEKILEKYG